MYDFWKSGLEIPLEGTPIRGWNVIPNSLQETLLLLGIMTVEDLANVTDEAVARIGTGGQYLRTKAKAWLDASVDKGKLAEENAALKLKVDTQGEQIATMQKAIEELKALVPQEKKVVEKPLASANF
jgi:predicted ATP-grasp superfamily ATP-dependent carboligase